MRGSEGQVGRIPQSVKDALAGQQFTNFADLRAAIWKAIGNDPALAAGWAAGNVGDMKNGNAPVALPEQWLNRSEGGRRYNIHHITPINRSGAALDLDDRPRTISWETGYEADDGTLHLRGWAWRYELTPAGTSNTAVTLSYDWSAASDAIRELIGFPPFPPEHLGNSLAHLAELVAS